MDHVIRVLDGLCSEFRTFDTSAIADVSISDVASSEGVRGSSAVLWLLSERLCPNFLSSLGGVL